MVSPYKSEDELPVINLSRPPINTIEEEEEEQVGLGLNLDDDVFRDDVNLDNTDYENAPIIDLGEYITKADDTSISNEIINEDEIPFIEANDNTRELPIYVGPNNALVNLPNYILNKAQNRGKASKMATYYYENDLTKEDIVGDPVLMDVIRRSLDSRYSESLTNQLYNLTSSIAGAPSGRRGRDFWKMGDEKVFETWQNWMRSLNGLNSVTVANEVSANLLATRDDRARIGAGYHLFSRMDNAYIGRGSWWETTDASWDYTKAAIHDPLTLLTFGLGKVLYAGGTKVTAEAVKRTARAFYVNQLRKNVAPDIARKNLVKSLARKELLGKTAAYMLPDMAQNVTLDLLSQVNLINVGNQEEIYKSQTAIALFASLFIPALTIGNVNLRKLREHPKIKDSWVGYQEIDEVVKEGLKTAQAVVNDRVNSNINDIKAAVDAHFGLRRPFDYWETLEGGYDGAVVKWEAAKEAAYKTLANESKKKDAFSQDLAHTRAFFREFFLDTVDETDGTILSKGYLTVLQEAGWVIHKDMLEENKISGIMAQSIQYLDDKTVMKIMKEFEKKTGKKLNLDYTAKALGARFTDTESEAGKILNISSQMMRDVLKETNNMNTVMQIVSASMEKNLDPERFQWALSIYKRLLTSHPATTGSNLKGFAALSVLDAAGDIFTSTHNIAFSAFYHAIKGDKEKGIYYANRAYGNFAGSLRKGMDVLNPELPIAYANILLDLHPKVKERLFRTVSGDGGMRDSLELFNLDKSKNPVYRAVDAATKGAQAISFMRLQDELSKLWAFGTNTNTNIMKVYGQSPSKFYSRPDIGVILNSPKFKDEVLGVSVWETSRQTASVNWSQLKTKFGNNLFRRGARFVEFMTNKTIVGVPVPFGSFTNTVVATFGDLTGINAARYMTTKAIAYKRGKPVDLDPETQSIEDATAKMMLGWSWIVWRTFHGENSAVNKVSEGRTFNQNRNESGELRDITYDWPLNQPDLIAQMIAHGLTGDGRDLKKDLHELRNNPDEFIKYVHDNFDVNNIPTGLYTRLALELSGSATRQADKIERYFGTQWLEFMDGLQGEDLKIALGDFLIGMIADGGAYIFQGATRFAEPYSVVGNMVFHEGNIPDLRQGNETWNLATKYINGLLPNEAFTLFGTTYGSSLAEEKRATLTEGLDRNVNVSKMLFGARRSPNLSVGQTMLNAAGIPSWKYNRWGGDPIVKNYLDILAAPEFEATAIEYLQKYPYYFRRNLKDKERILKIIREDFRARVLNKLKKFSPESMNLLKEVTSGDKEAMNFALNSLRQNNEIGADDEFDDIMKKENAVEILQHLKHLMDNYDDITYPQPLDKEVTNMLSPRYQ